MASPGMPGNTTTTPPPPSSGKVPSPMSRRIHCFRSGPYVRKRARRTTKLSAEAKQKVLEVRRQRACLRCKLLKIECSKESPCSPCLSSAVRGDERKVLSFCYCIRSRFAEVNIFENESTELGSLASKINSLVSRIGEQNRPPLYNQAAFEDVLGSWLTKPEFSLPNGSIVGLLCSKVLSSQLCAAVDADLVADFRTFLFTASLANSGWKGRDVTLRDLCQAAHKSGFNVISRLDHVLNRQGLIKRDRDIGPMLLLLILGVIIGVGYSAHLTSSPAFPHDMLDGSFQESPTLWVAMKQHLCQMLAHHLIFLGSTLGVKFGTGLEQQIIDTAVNRWNKVEVNMWADMLKNVDFSEEPAKNPGISPDVESATPLVAAACIDADELNQLANFTDSTPPQFPALGTFQGYDENPASFLEMSYDENPASYLEMGDDDLPEWSPPEAPPPYPGSPTGDAAEDDTGPAAQPVHSVKRRSVWVVRPFEDGKEGVVNVQARFRVGSGQGIGLFA